MTKATCATVQIETKNGPVTINAEDFDEKTMKEAGAKKKAAKKKAPAKKVAKKKAAKKKK